MIVVTTKATILKRDSSNLTLRQVSKFTRIEQIKVISYIHTNNCCAVLFNLMDLYVELVYSHKSNKIVAALWAVKLKIVIQWYPLLIIYEKQHMNSYWLVTNDTSHLQQAIKAQFGILNLLKTDQSYEIKHLCHFVMIALATRT